MKVLVRGISKETNEAKEVTLHVSSMAQARCFCSNAIELKSLHIRTISADSKVDINFPEVQQYLSVRQYRKVRKARNCSQFPVLDVKLNA